MIGELDGTDEVYRYRLSCGGNPSSLIRTKELF